MPISDYTQEEINKMREDASKGTTESPASSTHPITPLIEDPFNSAKITSEAAYEHLEVGDKFSKGLGEIARIDAKGEVSHGALIKADIEAVKRTSDALTTAKETLEKSKADPKSAQYKNLKDRVEKLEKDLGVQGASAQEKLHIARERIQAGRTHITEQLDASRTSITSAADAKLAELSALEGTALEGHTFTNAKGVELKGAEAVAAHTDAIHQDTANRIANAEAHANHLDATLTKQEAHLNTAGEAVGKQSNVTAHVPSAKGGLVGGKALSEQGVVGQAGWDKLGKETTFGQTKAAAVANWKQSGTAMKFVRGVASVGGLYVAVTSGFDLVKHAMGGTKKDDAGNEIPTTGSDLVVDAAKLAAGAGAVYLALVAGGKNKAINGPAMA